MNTTWRYSDARILIFAKAPVAGEVKTRLGQTIGMEAAAGLYQLMLQKTIETAVDSKLAPVELWCAPDASHAYFQAQAKRYDLVLQNQIGAGLGDRMLSAMAQGLRTCKFCILIGSDCPGIDSDYLAEALQALAKESDVVIGPALDGGYVLLGMRAGVHVDIFSRMPWSTAQVLSVTQARLQRDGVRYLLLPPQQDIDRPEDLPPLGVRDASGSSIRCK